MEIRSQLESRPRILSIDSNTASQKLVAQALAAEFDVATAAADVSSIETMKAFRPDAILLDVDLPNIDSFRICRLIRAESQFSRTPILFVSQLTGADEQFQGFQAGGDDYIKKPFDGEVLKDKLNLSLKRMQKNRKASELASNDHPALEQNIQYLHDYLLSLISLDTMDTLGDLLLSTLDKLNLKGALHWHFSGKTCSSIGPLTDLENVLLQQSKQTFPADHSARYLWGSANIGAIIHNMPNSRSPQYQALRQILATLFNATDRKIEQLRQMPGDHGEARHGSRLHSRKSTVAALDQHNLLTYGYKLEAALEELESESERYLSQLSQTLQNMADDPGRHELERQKFQRLLNQCIQTRIAIYDQCLEVQSQYGHILGSLERTLNEENTSESGTLA